MRPMMLDSEFDDMHGVDFLHDPEQGLEAYAGEPWEAESEPGCDSVWLECNGELLDVEAVRILGIRKSACGFETLLFACPRCNEPHESVRFR